MDNDNEINEIVEIESEGNVNSIPSSINISNKFLLDKNKSFVFSRNNSFILNKLNISNISRNLNYKQFKIKMNNTMKNEKYKYNIKSEDVNSITTKSSINYKLKKVTFSTVEIIRVTNYKSYNKLNSFKKADFNNFSWFYHKNCFIF